MLDYGIKQLAIFQTQHLNERAFLVQKNREELYLALCVMGLVRGSSWKQEINFYPLDVLNVKCINNDS